MARCCVRDQQLDKLSIQISTLSSPSDLAPSVAVATMQCMRSLLSDAFYTSTDAFPPLAPLFSTLFGWGIIWKIVNNLVLCGGNAACMVATATAAAASKASRIEV